MKRRLFLKSIGAASTLNFQNIYSNKLKAFFQSPKNDREYWINILIKIADPVLTALSDEKLVELMPVEVKKQEFLESRKKFTYLEGFGRLLCGMAPWIELAKDNSPEGKLRTKYFELIKKSLDNAVNPKSKDYMNFSEGSQPLVDAAFLSLALIRSPQIWNSSDESTKKNIILNLKKTRKIKPFSNNWLLFSAMIEAFFIDIGEEYDIMRIDYAIRQHEQWYKGDGMFGDGSEFHWDYYNSYVIQPFVSIILKKILLVDKSYSSFKDRFSQIALRYAEIQEGLIAPDGTFPAIGRSIAYRCGAFHHLANQALYKQLPKKTSCAQVRSALTAVIQKTLDDSKNYDKSNWLKIGLCNSQSDLAESYISTGSLYLCSTAFLPLGLPENDEFWNSPSTEWTSKKIWGGYNMDADKALKF